MNVTVVAALLLLVPNDLQLGDVGHELLRSLSQIVSLAAPTYCSLEPVFASTGAENAVRVGVGVDVELEQLVCVAQEWLEAFLCVLLGQDSRGLGGLEDTAQHKRANGTD